MVEGWRVTKTLQDTLIHKKWVIDTCTKMAEHLETEGKHELAILLMKRAAIHDNSKFQPDELDSLAQLMGTNNGMTDPNYVLTTSDRRLIESHWKHNRHHPEFYKSSDEMQEIDIIEMVCDWAARSLQFKTHLMDFVTTRQENRFHFSNDIYEVVLKYSKIVIKIYPEIG